MRIISGKWKGRRLNPPKNIPTRPTTDIAKEGLFNILENYFDFSEVAFLDLFSGTGSISYEFASRGCANITAVERFPRCVDFIRTTVKSLSMPGVNVIKGDVFRFIEMDFHQYDIIFAGPPYRLPRLEDLPDLILQHGLLKPGGWFILEHDPAYTFDTHPAFAHRRNYGQTNFSIFIHRVDDASQPPPEQHTQTG